MQPEDEEHLRRPSADSLDLDERVDDFFVGKRIERVQVEASTTDPVAQVTEVCGFLPAHTCSAQRIVGDAREALDGGNTTGHEGNHPAVDGRGRLGRELLSGDGANERREVIRSLSGSKATGAMPPNQRRQYWVTTEEHPTRALVVGRGHCARS